MSVSTPQGVIVLRGKTGSEDARLAAEEVARKIERAQWVENRLVVVPIADRS